MEAILERALAIPGVCGVLVLMLQSGYWLTIASRGELSSSDAPEVLRLLQWTTPGSDETGSIAWGQPESHMCIHFHCAKSHTLVLLREPKQLPHAGTIPIVMAPGSAPLRAPPLTFRLSSASDTFFKAASASVSDISRSFRPSSWY